MRSRSSQAADAERVPEAHMAAHVFPVFPVFLPGGTFNGPWRVELLMEAAVSRQWRNWPSIVVSIARLSAALPPGPRAARDVGVCIF